MLILMLSLFVLLILFLQKKSKYAGRLPPGPRGIPCFGNLFQISTNLPLSLYKWADTYGDIYTIKLADKTAVVISSVELLKDVLKTKAGGGIYRSEALVNISNGPYGIGHNEGKAWHEVRQFFLENLKYLGVRSNSSWESVILSEIDNFTEWMGKGSEQCGISIKKLQMGLQNSASSSLRFVMTGPERPGASAVVNKLTENVTTAIQKCTRSGLVVFPKLKYVSPNWSGYASLRDACSSLHTHMETEFKRRWSTHLDGNVKDLLDCYVQKVKTTKDVNSSFYQTLGQQNTISTFVELIISSYETTGTTLTWALIYLATHPEAQKRLREEIKSVVGFTRDPSIHDRNKMVYTNAVILETFRLSSLVPFGLPHELLENLQCQQYILPKGTIIFPNLYYIHHNNRTWSDPQVFSPERFLENKDLEKYVIPFQVGRRSCPGAQTARDNFFLYITKLVQKFEFSVDPGTPKDKYLTPEVGLVHVPMENTIMFKKVKD